MYQAGLVLEGGGMKGVYTAGVLDFFTEKGISGTRNPKNTFAFVKQKSPDIQRILKKRNRILKSK